MAEERLPADIFEEMAGVREITPEPSEISENNVNQEIIKTEINEDRLTEASKHLLKKVPEFQQYLVKLAKKLFSFQKKEAKPIKPSPLIVKIPNYKKKKENSEAKAIAKLWDSVIKPILYGFQFIISQIVKGLLKLVTWAFKLLMNLGKFLIKLFFKIVKTAFKLITNILKTLSKFLLKALRMIWRGLVRLVKAFWNILLRLFHKVKKKIKGLTLKEPRELKMNQQVMKLPKNPVLEMGHEVSMENNKLKKEVIKPVKLSTTNLNPRNSFVDRTISRPKESFIWKIFKKILNYFLKLLRKIISKVFGKIIKKLINVVVKIIVRFVALQLIGSLIPGLGNAFALGMTAISAILLITDAVGFIKDLTQNMEAPEDDIENERDEEMEKKVMRKSPPQTFEYYDKLIELRSQQREGGMDYLYTKQSYLVGLLKQAEQTGNLKEAKIIKDALGLAADETSDDTPSFDAVYETDLKELEKKLAKDSADIFYKRQKINKKQIIGNEEIEEILISAEGEPEWLIFWQRIMKYISSKVKERLDKNIYIEAAKSSLNGKDKKVIEKIYSIDEVKLMYNERKSKRNTSNSSSMNNLIKTMRLTLGKKNKNILDDNFYGFNLELSTHFVDYKGSMKNIKYIIEDNKTDLFDETAEIRSKNSDCNWAQHEKLNRFKDILRILSVKNKYNS